MLSTLIILLIASITAHVIEKCYAFLDLYVIEAVERVTQKFEHWTGINNFKIARIFLVAGVILVARGFFFIETKQTDEVTQWMGNFMVALIIPIHSMVLIASLLTEAQHILSKTETKVIREISRARRNPLKIEELQFKIRDLLWFGAVWLSLVFSILIYIPYGTVAGAVMMYFWALLYACDPLPPGQSKIRQWITGIRAHFSKPATVSITAFRSS